MRRFPFGHRAPMSALARVLVRVLVRVLAVQCFACGGEPAPARAPEPAPPSEAKPSRPAFRMTSELGSVEPGDVKRAFHALNDKFTDCQKQGLDRVEVLAGSVKFFVRIGADGQARWAYLEESELGDRTTEKCLVDAALGARWPKPDGGDAEVRYALELPLQSTRPPTDWPPEKVTPALARYESPIAACKGSASSSFHATVYVGPGGGVLAAGVVTAAKDADAQVDCIAGILAKLKGLPSPGSWPAKVRFAL